MSISFIVMIYAVEAAMTYDQVGIHWLLITYLLHTWGELALSPIGLSAFSRYSPKIYWPNVWLMVYCKCNRRCPCWSS